VPHDGLEGFARGIVLAWERQHLALGDRCLVVVAHDDGVAVLAGAVEEGVFGAFDLLCHGLARHLERGTEPNEPVDEDDAGLVQILVRRQRVDGEAMALGGAHTEAVAPIAQRRLVRRELGCRLDRAHAADDILFERLGLFPRAFALEFLVVAQVVPHDMDGASLREASAHGERVPAALLIGARLL
jgi:hypothetical protein